MKFDIEAFIPNVNRELVFRFFLVFSRFEYALKKTRFKAEAYGDGVKADWCAFWSAYENDFEVSKHSRLEEAWAYLITNPPRKQTLENHSLSWTAPLSRGNESELKWLVKIIRVIRNNLFHGGKFPFPEIEDPVRNSTLLKHALSIVEVCVELDTEVERAFSEPNC